MELSILKQYVILAINPDKGKVSVDGIRFRYTLSGALLMDYLEKGEITMENKLLILSFRKNGDPAHDLYADLITKSSKTRKISFWARRLADRSRYIFRETVSSLEKERILRCEHKKFLNLIPYNRYWFIDKRLRINIIEELRGVLLYNRKATIKQSMLLGLIKASEAHNLLSKEKGELKLIRKKNSEFLKGDVFSTEINQAIKETQAAIIGSVVAASVAARG
ncbi:MAG: GPP34 family phosphoprotein [Bacteroidales bacterium]|nr:GPP34 family phosphoprotein [Bacteroidales bacterium]